MPADPNAARSIDDDPVLAALDRAPVDHVPESDEEREAVHAAKLEAGYVTGDAMTAAIAARSPKP